MPYLRKLLIGIKDSVKWVLILFAIIIVAELLVFAGCYVVSALSSYSARELWLSFLQFTGGRGLYSPYMALSLPIPAYCVLFSFWHAFLPEKRHLWTYIFPYAIYMCLCVVYILSELDWNYKIISIDDFMVETWLAPLFGIAIQSVIRLLKKRLSSNRRNPKSIYQE